MCVHCHALVSSTPSCAASTQSTLIYNYFSFPLIHENLGDRANDLIISVSPVPYTVFEVNVSQMNKKMSIKTVGPLERLSVSEIRQGFEEVLSMTVKSHFTPISINPRLE